MAVQLFPWHVPIGYVGGDKSKPVWASKDFFRAMSGAQTEIEDASRTGDAEEAVTLTGSPFTYTAATDGYVLVKDGTVTQIDYIRSASSAETGTLNGMFPILKGDSLKITYAAAPTVTFVPR